MKHDFSYGARQEFLRPRMGWEIKLALCFLAAAILIALATEAFGQKGGAHDQCRTCRIATQSNGSDEVTGDAHPIPRIQLSHPICPSGWSIAQRYDVRDRNGQIVVSKDHWIKVNGRVMRTGWHRTCITPIIWFYR